MILGVISSKGGLGVSSITLNLGIMLRQQTRDEVVIAEYRPGYGGISLDLGYNQPDGLTHLLQKRPSDISIRDVEMELITHGTGVRLLLASPDPKDAQYLTNVDNFEAITQFVQYLGKYLVIDLGSSLNPVARNTISVLDKIIIVMEPTPSSVVQTKKMIAALRDLGMGEGSMLLVLNNRVRSTLQLTWTEIQEEIGLKISTVITPAPELAYQASMNHMPMVVIQRDGITASQFEKLADAITGMSQ